MPTKTELRAKLEALLREEGASFGSDALAGELVDVIEKQGGLRLDAEAPVRLTYGALSEAGKGITGTWVGPATHGGILLKVYPNDKGTPEAAMDLVRQLLAAYNERQEIDEIEADVDNAISTGIEQLCREAVAAEVEKGVAGERERCLAHADWLLSCFPKGWDFARRNTEAARERIACGARRPNGLPVPEPHAPPFRGQHLASPDGERCALCGKDWTHMHTPEQVADWKARGGSRGLEDLPNSEPSNWPEFLEPVPAGSLGSSFWVSKKSMGTGYLSREEAEEVCRRWEEEPRLRAEVERLSRENGRIEAAADMLRRGFPAETRAIDEGKDPAGVQWTALEAYRILTGKD